MKLRAALLLLALLAGPATARKHLRPRSYVAPCAGVLNVTSYSCIDAHTQWVDVGEGAHWNFRYDGPPWDNFIVRMMPSGKKVLDAMSRTEIGNFAEATLLTRGDRLAQITVVPGGLCGLAMWQWSATCATSDG